MGKQSRFKKESEKMQPGPDQYYFIKYPQNDMGTFSRTKKFFERKFLNPGPSDYKLQSAYRLKEPVP